MDVKQNSVRTEKLNEQYPHLVRPKLFFHKDTAIQEERIPKRIELGAGQNPVDEHVLTVDKRDHNDPDAVMDLEETPWDLPSDYFEEVYMNHCLEHLENWADALKEIYRIAAPGAEVVIRVPHGSISVLSPDHIAHFSYGSLKKHVTPTSQEYIGEVDFTNIRETLRWRHYSHRKTHTRHAECYLLDPLGKVIDALVNLPHMPVFADRFCYWFSGFEEIECRLQVQK